MFSPALAGMAIEEFTLIMDGKTYNKKQLLSKVKPQEVLLFLSFESVKLKLEGEIAVLDGIAVIRAQNAPTMGALRQSLRITLSNVTDDGWGSSPK